MKPLELKRTEADVVIVVTHDYAAGRVYPLWECDSSADELNQMGAQMALNVCEELGGGSAYYQIIDHRTIAGN